MTCTRCNGSGKEPNHKSIGKSLRQMRKDAGLSMREMGQILRLSHSFLSQLETGRRSWKLSVRQRYAAAVAEAKATI